MRDTSFDDSIGADTPFPMGHLTHMVRQRATPIQDAGGPAYDEDWTHPELLEFDGYLASQSSTETTASTNPRDQGTLTSRQLIIPDPTTDIREHDRIIIQGDTWTVTGIPTRDINPFTGWQPTLVANLEHPQGGI